MAEASGRHGKRITPFPTDSRRDDFADKHDGITGVGLGPHPALDPTNGVQQYGRAGGPVTPRDTPELIRIVTEAPAKAPCQVPLLGAIDVDGEYVGLAEQADGTARLLHRYADHGRVKGRLH